MTAYLRSCPAQLQFRFLRVSRVLTLLLAFNAAAAEPDAGTTVGEEQARPSSPPANDAERLLNLMFGDAACVHPTRLCLEAPSYATDPGKLINHNAPENNERGERADRSLFPSRAAVMGAARERPEEAYLQAAQPLGTTEYLDRLGADLVPLLKPGERLRLGSHSPYWGLRDTDWQYGLKTGEKQKIVALFIVTGISKDRPFGSKSLAHLLTTFTKGGENIEYDVLLPTYVAQLRKAMPPEAKETALKDGAVQFRIDTEHESAVVVIGLERSVDTATGRPRPDLTRLYIMKSVFSWDELRRVRAEAVRAESAAWLERRLNATGMSTKEELFEYELAAAKKLSATEPGKALDNLAPLAFFQQANTEAALAIRQEALKSQEAMQRAAKAEADKRAAAELAAKAKRDAVARKAQAEAAARSKALWAGVKQSLTPEGALFDIDAAKGQLAIWQGSLLKKLFGTTYLASTGGVFWCLRLDGGATGPGYFVAKGTVTGGCKITDGIRDLTVPELTGTFVDLN